MCCRCQWQQSQPRFRVPYPPRIEQPNTQGANSEDLNCKVVYTEPCNRITKVASRQVDLVFATEIDVCELAGTHSVLCNTQASARASYPFGLTSSQPLERAYHWTARRGQQSIFRSLFMCGFVFV